MPGYAIVGCGYVAGRHVQAAIDLPDTRVAALCDIDEDTAKALAAKHDLDCRVVTDYREALAHGDVHLVVCALPTPLHFELCKAAAEAGKNIYMEKPLAQTLEEGREMMAICERAGVKMVVGHSHRYFPVLQRARTLVREGVIGELTKMRSVLCYYNDFASEQRLWKLDASLPLHGALLDVGVHVADDIHYVSDSHTVRLYAEGGCTRPSETDLIDSGVAVLRLANGVVAEWEVNESQTTGGKFPCQNTTEIYGTQGALLIQGSKLSVFIHGKGGKEGEFREESHPATPFFSSWLHLHRDFVKSIKDDTPVPIPPIAGYRSLQVVDAVFTSIREQRAVQLPEVPEA